MSVARRLSMLVAVAVFITTGAMTARAFNPDTLVSVGSPSAPFPQNKQNEPALAVDANHPNVLAAGANDEIDLEACNAGGDTTCPFTAGVGISGIYFSFDSGTTWTQPTYTGWTARDCLGAVGPDAACVPHVGPIGTLPKYFENGLVSDGDPALAFGPRPGPGGTFAWSNGSRLYYANLTSNFGRTKREETFKGFEAIAVSRTDDVRAAAAGAANAWLDPVIATRQSSTTFSDKVQIWADNAASSPFFGNVYLCVSSFRSKGRGLQFPEPLIVLTSADGGSTWTQRQITSASTTGPRQGNGRSGCAVRTDSQGVVYVFAKQFASDTGLGAHLLIKSFDGGQSWTRPATIDATADNCFVVQFDGVGLRCVEDGIAGARNDLSGAPSVDIANGAPTGVGATDEILRTWVDSRNGLNQEHVLVSFSTDGGASWSSGASVETAGDRGLYSAIAVSPGGTDAYLVYNAFTTPFRNDTTSPRGLVGVVKHADIDPVSGQPGAWTELHRGAAGDPRGSSQNNLFLEFLGDYVSAVATQTYGAAVWNDVRNAADCPAIDAWRAAAQSDPTIPNPAPQQVCPATFGNSNIFGGSYPDPTP